MDFNYRYRFICLIKPNIRMGKILSFTFKKYYIWFKKLKSVESGKEFLGLSWVISLLFFVKLFLNISLFDTQCGFKLYKKTTAKKIFSQLTNYGFTHDLELVIISKKLEFEIIELPVKWTHKKGSKLNIFFEPIKMFLNIIYLRFKYTSLKRLNLSNKKPS